MRLALTAPLPITLQTRMGEIIERWPGDGGAARRQRVRPPADPAHQALVKGLPVTLEMACARHGVSPEDLLAHLNAAIGD